MGRRRLMVLLLKLALERTWTLPSGWLCNSVGARRAWNWELEFGLQHELGIL